MKYIIDRVEGKIAVCEAEDRTMTNLPLSRLYPGAKEGDCIVSTPNGEFVLDETRTRKRKQELKKRLEDLFQ